MLCQTNHQPPTPELVTQYNYVKGAVVQRNGRGRKTGAIQPGLRPLPSISTSGMATIDIAV